MQHFREHYKGYLQAVAFVLAELVLFGASEGPQKLQFIEYGTAANILVAVAFKYL